MRSDSNEASSNVEKATLLNQILSRNFNYDIEPLSESNSYQFIADPSSPVSEDIVCTDGDVFCLLCAIDTTKASGPDGIYGRMLKGTAESITPSLTHMFNMSIKAARVPTSLGSRPSPYVRVLIARGWANRSSGKAWDDSSREA